MKLLPRSLSIFTARACYTNSAAVYCTFLEHDQNSLSHSTDHRVQNYRENGGEKQLLPPDRVNYMKYELATLPGHRELDRSRACSHSGLATFAELMSSAAAPMEIGAWHQDGRVVCSGSVPCVRQPRLRRRRPWRQRWRL
jgi:hypothetical protein